MKSNISVINNTGKNFVVTTDNKDGNVQIIIDLASNKKELSSLKPGHVFNKNGIEYIVLKQLSDNTTAVIRKNSLDEKMEFDYVSNNWITSNIRNFLNGKYLKNIASDFDEGNIIFHSVDLLSLDGLDDYGISTDKVSLFTIDMYRKYRKVLGDNIYDWWLITPNSTHSGGTSVQIPYIDSTGLVRFESCNGSKKNARPFFILKSDISVFCDRTSE